MWADLDSRRCHLLTLLFVLGSSQLQAQIPPGFYWNGVRLIPPTPEALKKILTAHNLWLESDGISGARAQLSHADLSNMNLAGADLWGADLEGAVLAGADLTGAKLGPSGQGGQRGSAPTPRFFLSPPTMVTAKVVDASGRVVSESPVPPGPPDLHGVLLMNAVADGADFSLVNLSKAVLTGANLSGANLDRSNLSGAYLVRTELDGANLTDANLDGTTFEPKFVSPIIGIEFASNLDRIRFDGNPDALIKIRKQFQDEGLRGLEREVTYAINRRQTDLDPAVERWFRLIAFDLTCQYGMSPGRPLRIIAAAWACFTAIYLIFAHWGRCFRVRISRFYGGKDKLQEFWMCPAPPRALEGKKGLPSWIRFERRAFPAMAFFSLVNAFNIGYREFNVGQWLRMLTKRQYEVKPVGWVRSLAGAQSLLTVYLFALWILVYFGHPFE
jgi:hypothetical protein